MLFILAYSIPLIEQAIPYTNNSAHFRIRDYNTLIPELRAEIAEKLSQIVSDRIWLPPYTRAGTSLFLSYTSTVSSSVPISVLLSTPLFGSLACVEFRSELVTIGMNFLTSPPALPLSVKTGPPQCTRFLLYLYSTCACASYLHLYHLCFLLPAFTHLLLHHPAHCGRSHGSGGAVRQQVEDVDVAARGSGHGAAELRAAALPLRLARPCRSHSFVRASHSVSVSESISEAVSESVTECKYE